MDTIPIKPIFVLAAEDGRFVTSVNGDGPYLTNETDVESTWNTREDAEKFIPLLSRVLGVPLSVAELHAYSSIVMRDGHQIGSEARDWFPNDEAAKIGLRKLLEAQNYQVASVEIGDPCRVTLKPHVASQAPAGQAGAIAGAAKPQSEPFRFILYGAGSGAVYGVSNEPTIEDAWKKMKTRVVRYAEGDADTMAAMEKKSGPINKTREGFWGITLLGSDEGGFALADLRSPDPIVQTEIRELGLVKCAHEFLSDPEHLKGRGRNAGVRDHPQSAVISDGMIMVSSRIGQERAGEVVSLDVQEWLDAHDHANPDYSKRELIRKATASMEADAPEEAAMGDRIRDSMVAAIDAAFANAGVDPAQVRRQQLGSAVSVVRYSEAASLPAPGVQEQSPDRNAGAGAQSPPPYDKSRRFVLSMGNGVYVGNLGSLDMNPLVSRDDAMVMDWRDNEQLKANYFAAVFGLPVTPEEIPAAKEESAPVPLPSPNAKAASKAKA
jgi:hypothetical protein